MREILGAIRSRRIHEGDEFQIDEVKTTIDKLGARAASLFLVGLRANGIVARSAKDLSKDLKPVEKDILDPDTLVVDLALMKELSSPITYNVDTTKDALEARLTMGKRSYTQDLPKPMITVGPDETQLDINRLFDTISTEDELEKFIKSPNVNHHMPVIRGLDLIIKYIETVVAKDIHIKESSPELQLFAFMKFAQQRDIDISKLSPVIEEYISKNEERLITERIDIIFSSITEATVVESRKSNPGMSDTAKNVRASYNDKGIGKAKNAIRELALIGIDDSAVDELLAIRRNFFDQLVSAKVASLKREDQPATK